MCIEIGSADSIFMHCEVNAFEMDIFVDKSVANNWICFDFLYYICLHICYLINFIPTVSKYNGADLQYVFHGCSIKIMDTYFNE